MDTKQDGIRSRLTFGATGGLTTRGGVGPALWAATKVSETFDFMSRQRPTARDGLKRRADRDGIAHGQTLLGHIRACLGASIAMADMILQQAQQIHYNCDDCTASREPAR